MFSITTVIRISRINTLHERIHTALLEVPVQRTNIPSECVILICPVAELLPKDVLKIWIACVLYNLHCGRLAVADTARTCIHGLGKPIQVASLLRFLRQCQFRN